MSVEIEDRVMEVLANAGDYVNHDMLMAKAGFGLDEEAQVVDTLRTLVRRGLVVTASGKKGKKYCLAE